MTSHIAHQRIKGEPRVAGTLLQAAAGASLVSLRASQPPGVPRKGYAAPRRTTALHRAAARPDFAPRPQAARAGAARPAVDAWVVGRGGGSLSQRRLVPN